jgi:hypothetical protein
LDNRYRWNHEIFAGVLYVTVLKNSIGILKEVGGVILINKRQSYLTKSILNDTHNPLKGKGFPVHNHKNLLTRILLYAIMASQTIL